MLLNVCIYYLLLHNIQISIVNCRLQFFRVIRLSDHAHSIVDLLYLETMDAFTGPFYCELM